MFEPAANVWANVSGAEGVVLGTLAGVALAVGLSRWIRLGGHRRRSATSVADTPAQAMRDLDFTLRAIGEAVLATDTDGKLVRINPAAESLLQAWAVDVIARPLEALVELRSADPVGRRLDPVGDVLRDDPNVVQGERMLMRRRDGTDRMVAVTATPIRQDGGEVQGAVLVLRDVTAEHQLEQQVCRFHGMEALALLAGGVAHDFNNLLQVVRVNLEFLAEKKGLDPEASEYVGEIRRATLQAAELTHQLLALARRQPLRKQLLELGGLTEAFLRVLRRILGPQIEVRFSPPLNPLWACADAGQVEQVLLSLALHAREAMPLGGRLELAVRSAEVTEAELPRLRGAHAGEFVVLSLRDSGLGLDDAALARVFEPFQPGDQAASPRFGLSLVFSVVRQHGGFVHVASALGHGTSFDVYLPRQAAPEAPDTARGATVGCALPTGHVLVVEDDPSVRMIATTVLVRHGYRVLEACDGLEACELVRERAEELCVVVMDVVMPRLGGVEAARTMALTRPDLPIVLCTGHSDAGLAEVPEVERHWHVLNKPFGSEELLRTVAAALACAPAR